MNIYLIILLAINLVLIAVMKPFLKRLKASGERCSIVDLQLAGNAQSCKRIITQWRDAGVEPEAFRSLYIDFAFLIAYPAFLADACWTIAGGSGLFDQIGMALGFTVLTCILFDALENLSLLRILTDGPTDTLALFTLFCAANKFFLAGLTVLYLFIALIRQLFLMF